MAKPAKAIPPAVKLFARLTGARLCFGDAVAANGRTVIPVAAVRSMGGGGFGSGPPASPGQGGGGGGALDARPVGFIEIGPEGTRFERIDDGREALRALAAASLVSIVVGRALSRRRRRAVLPGARARASIESATARVSRRRGLPARLAGRALASGLRRAPLPIVRRRAPLEPPAPVPARAPRRRGVLARVAGARDQASQGS